MTDAYSIAAQRNTNLSRDDIEWFVAASGELMLRDKPSWTERRTKELAASAEAARRDFNHRQRYPAQEPVA